MPELGQYQRGEGLDEYEFFGTVVTADINSGVVDVSRYDEATVIVVVSAASGTTPTLVPEVEVSGDGTNFVHRCTIIDPYTQGSLTRTTVPTVEGKIQATGVFNCQLTGNLCRYMRLGLTVGGTTPSFTIVATGYFR